MKTQRINIISGLLFALLANTSLADNGTAAYWSSTVAANAASATSWSTNPTLPNGIAYDLYFDTIADDGLNNNIRFTNGGTWTANSINISNGTTTLTTNGTNSTLNIGDLSSGTATTLFNYSFAGTRSDGSSLFTSSFLIVNLNANASTTHFAKFKNDFEIQRQWTFNGSGKIEIDSGKTLKFKDNTGASSYGLNVGANSNLNFNGAGNVDLSAKFQMAANSTLDITGGGTFKVGTLTAGSATSATFNNSAKLNVINGVLELERRKQDLSATQFWTNDQAKLTIGGSTVDGEQGKLILKANDQIIDTATIYLAGKSHFELANNVNEKIGALDISEIGNSLVLGNSSILELGSIAFNSGSSLSIYGYSIDNNALITLSQLSSADLAAIDIAGSSNKSSTLLTAENTASGAKYEKYAAYVNSYIFDAVIPEPAEISGLLAGIALLFIYLRKRV